MSELPTRIAGKRSSARAKRTRSRARRRTLGSIQWWSVGREPSCQDVVRDQDGYGAPDDGSRGGDPDATGTAGRIIPLPARNGRYQESENAGLDLANEKTLGKGVLFGSGNENARIDVQPLHRDEPGARHPDAGVNDT